MDIINYKFKIYKISYISYNSKIYDWNILSSQFNNTLNNQQTKSVLENISPLLIIAGAESGKTRVIASKIAYLINKGTKPDNILAITFTQKAAEEMLDRTTSLVGDSPDLKITTFHSFCNDFIQENILETRLDSNFKTITETAQLVFFAKNVNTFG